MKSVGPARQTIQAAADEPKELSASDGLGSARLAKWVNQSRRKLRGCDLLPINRNSLKPPLKTQRLRPRPSAPPSPYNGSNPLAHCGGRGTCQCHWPPLQRATSFGPATPARPAPEVSYSSARSARGMASRK